MNKKKQEAVIEAVLFSMGESVSVNKLAELIEASVGDTKKIVYDMMKKMDADDRGVTIVELGDSFQMCSKQEMYEYLIDLTSSERKFVLSDSALETLSIIAYKQPVTRLDIEKIRGVNSDHAVNRLLEFDLIKELGRLDAPGKPILFGTTEQFLRSFGVKSLEDLPEMSQIQLEEFREQAEQEVQLRLDI
ncbi:MAG: SMC-Scp complex subunit ScpB [Lachnospiraceae bacterium]|nr:SMC-Scp complex subunit ScpB [Candidatus Colinaster equi]